MQPSGFGPMFGVTPLLVTVVIWLAMIVGYVVFLVAAWRAMRAHERIADMVGQIAQRLRAQQ